jgi:hypothetical protein
MARASWLKNTLTFPQRGKGSSVSGFALLSILERNRARSALKRFFHQLALAKLGLRGQALPLLANRE